MNKNYKSNKAYYAISVVLGLFLVLVIENSSLLTSEKAPEVAAVSPQMPAMDRDTILTDPKNIIDPDFSIPEGLERRVSFWFDVYSKYDSTNKIIHHLDYPWIQFEIFNVSDILARPQKFPWTNPEKADKETRIRLHVVQSELKSLAKKIKSNKLHQLTEREQLWIDQLQQIPGSILKNVRTAAKRVRVQTGQKDFFAKGLSVANRYLPHMEQIFKNHGLPKEIARLPLVESSFNKLATSKVGAAGLWQFMDGTGKKFLLINDFIDERRSPLKSTEAAAELLKENFMIMGKTWPLAITAYNHGPSGIKKAVKKLNSKNIVKIISHFESKQFSFASENFYCEFLAALYVESYSNELFLNIEKLETLTYEPFKLTKRIKPSKILEIASLTREALLDLNPDIRKAIHLDIKLPKGFVVFVPPNKLSDLEKLHGQDVVAKNP